MNSKKIMNSKKHILFSLSAKMWVAVFTAAVLVVVAVLCKPFLTEAKEQKRPPIKIAVSTWPGWSHVFLAKEKGFFEKNHVDVELRHTNEHIDAQVPFLNGEVDGVFQCLTDTVIQNTQLHSKVVYVSDYSSAGDVIVGDTDTLAALKEKTIGIEGVNTFSHIFVLKALENVGLNETEVQFDIVSAHKVLEALENGRISGGHTWEPTKSDAVEKGYKILATAGDNPGIISDLLVFHSKVIAERPDDIQAIVKSLVEAQQYRDANWAESIEIMAKAVKISFEDMESGLKGTDQLDLQGNIKAMTESDDPISLYVSGKFIADFYLTRGQLSQKPNLDEMIEPRFINELAGDEGINK